MQKITRKEFTAILTEKASVFMGSVFRWNDEKCARAMEGIARIDEKTERRTVTENHASYILFSNGSRLDFNQEGKKEYFEYENENGVKFVLQKTTVQVRDWDAEEEYWKEHHNSDCGEIYKEQQDYVVYAVIEAEADAERTFRNVEITDAAEFLSFTKWLKANGYYYESSGFSGGYHLEIRCSEKEAEIINGKLERMAA